MLDHRRCAEECVAMARMAENNQDKALWLTLATSWVRLAEHVARAETSAALETSNDQLG
jgi:Tfp pilus assembly protein PilX